MFWATWPVSKEEGAQLDVAGVSKSTCAPSSAAAMIALGAG
jgi:hypothetical protein